MTDFASALAAFMTAADNTAFAPVNAKMANNFPNGYYNKLEAESGSKFVRIVSSSNGSRSVWCFVEKATGDILKSEGWKKPSKIRRGFNVHTPESYQGKMDAYGSWLYIR